MFFLWNLAIAAAGAAAYCIAAIAIAAQPLQPFPHKPMRLVIGNPPGSQIDTLARTIGQKMSEHWGKPVVIDNRTGAGETLAAATAVKSTPDGHTLLVTTTRFLINAALHARLPYDPLDDFAGVTQLGFATLALIVPTSLGVHSIQQLSAFGNYRPGRMIFAFPGAGSGPHLVGEELIRATAMNAVRVAFKGGPETLIEVIAGRAQFALVSLGIALPHVSEGKLRVIAVNTPQRSPLLPDVPTLAEALPGGFRKPSGSYGLLAPARTPLRIRELISSEVARILRLPDVAERLKADAVLAAPTTPDEYDRIRRAQIERFVELTKAAGLRAR